MALRPESISISDYTYHLPQEKIALYPLSKRDASKLLVYKKGDITETKFEKLADFLPEKSLLVFNNTKVVPARLLFSKPTGGSIEIFVLEPADNIEINGAMNKVGSIQYKCLVKGAAKWKSNKLVKEVSRGLNACLLEAEIIKRLKDSFVIQFTWQPVHLTFSELLEIFGEMPIPPYLHRSAETQDTERYQTIYAQQNGSVAAPTAGLHFTKNILAQLVEADIKTAYTTLHVGAGTFKPIKSETIGEHEMHAEWISVEKEFLKELLLTPNTIPVGTTSMRTLESLFWLGAMIVSKKEIRPEQLVLSQWDIYEKEWPSVSAQQAITALMDWMTENQLNKLTTKTQILIVPGYTFKICKGLITNFHQPQSTLLLLIAALIGKDWKQAYEYALQHDFRFLSYGDSSLLLP